MKNYYCWYINSQQTNRFLEGMILYFNMKLLKRKGLKTGHSTQWLALFWVRKNHFVANFGRVTLNHFFIRCFFSFSLSLSYTHTHPHTHTHTLSLSFCTLFWRKCFFVATLSNQVKKATDWIQGHFLQKSFHNRQTPPTF